MDLEQSTSDYQAQQERHNFLRHVLCRSPYLAEHVDVQRLGEDLDRVERRHAVQIAAVDVHLHHLFATNHAFDVSSYGWGNHVCGGHLHGLANRLRGQVVAQNGSASPGPEEAPQSKFQTSFIFAATNRRTPTGTHVLPKQAKSRGLPAPAEATAAIHQFYSNHHTVRCGIPNSVEEKPTADHWTPANSQASDNYIDI